LLLLLLRLLLLLLLLLLLVGLLLHLHLHLQLPVVLLPPPLLQSHRCCRTPQHLVAPQLLQLVPQHVG
jgi:hypothetical protein